jgi:tRNA dimethylallyltransferase
VAPRVDIILGPTASGKTALAIERAKKEGGAVISADSRQIYAGLNIGTAKPKAAWREDAHDTLTPDKVDGVDHYLLNITPLNEALTLAQWQQAAFAVLAHLVDQGQTPIIAGGTMLYLDSVLYNYVLPHVPQQPELRRALEAEPVEILYERLLTNDPDAKSFIEPRNKRRIIRALEVMEVTGQPFSRTRQRGKPRYNFSVVGLFPGWDELKKNITARAEQMLKDGLLAETQHLQKKFGPETPLLQTMNYKQMAAALAGEISEEEALRQMIQIQLRYARRQMSWWKGREDITWFTAASDAAAFVQRPA